MTLNNKIEILKRQLNKTESNYVDSFKADIIMYFDEDFSEENQKLSFLNKLNSKEEIENFINKLISRFVMKFDADGESENDFIHDYLING
jgi:hypothetical protein